jgi:hypothetical protein
MLLLPLNQSFLRTPEILPSKLNFTEEDRCATPIVLERLKSQKNLGFRIESLSIATSSRPTDPGGGNR